jgi:hypothetical protein
MSDRPRIFKKIVLFWLAGALALSSCTFSLAQVPSSGNPTPVVSAPIPMPKPVPMAETAFSVTLPGPIPVGATLSLAVLDEVTGLPINPLYYPLNKKDDTHYGGNIALPLYGVVKYRYILQNGLPVSEDNAFDQPVRYRMYYVTGPGEVNDVVSSWAAQPFNGSTGKIQGQAINTTDGKPLTNILVTAGSSQVLTDSLGNFVFEGLPAGTHNLVGYSMDGAFETFQQGAAVAAGTSTPVVVSMRPAKMVNVTFIVSVPENTVVGAPVRMAGNLLQFGNTFADLDGGVSTAATRMPNLIPLSDGRFSLTLSLPVGADIRYKYTLGDGLWNSEHGSKGEFRVRQLIVTEQDMVVQDQVLTWQSGPSSPILFEVVVPATTPPTDTVAIQFNPYGWTEPIPMWAVGNNRWVYKVFGPLDMLGAFGYRYCRNSQCNSADDAATAGMVSPGRRVSTSISPQDLKDIIENWQWAPVSQPFDAQVAVNVRPAGFIAGVEFQPSYDPTWSPLAGVAFQNALSYRADWVFLTPTWTVSSNNPLLFSPQPGNDPLWGDTLGEVASGHKLGLNVGLFPTPRFSNLADDWRSVDPSDWNVWFDAYRNFALYHADLAAASGAQALILGGERIPPALYDGNPAADEKFRSLIGEIRQRYTGSLLWAYYYPGIMQSPPPFLDMVDGVYVLWNAPLSTNPAASPQEMAVEAGRLLDADILPFAVSIQKPITLAIAYPSVYGSATGCLPGPAGGCLDWMAFSRPNPDLPAYQLDLQGQANIYDAMLLAVNDRPWLSGFVSRGYYPPAALADKSASINGKPSSDVIGFWYSRMLGINP